MCQRKCFRSTGRYLPCLTRVWNVTLDPFLFDWENKLTDKMLHEIIKFYGMVGASPDGKILSQDSERSELSQWQSRRRQRAERVV